MNAVAALLRCTIVVIVALVAMAWFAIVDTFLFIGH